LIDEFSFEEFVGDFEVDDLMRDEKGDRGVGTSAFVA
jgi:hypothetical protein